MIFSMSLANVINAIIISAGIGVCLLNVVQVSVGTELGKETPRYFRFFFGFIIAYISAHLARQLLEGLDGNGVGIALKIVTFVEFLSSVFVVHMIALLTLFVANPKKLKTFAIVLFAIVFFHFALLTVSQFTDLLYYFDASNVYHRSPAYLVSNVAHLLIILSVVYLLIRYRKKFPNRLLNALWVYVIAPTVAILVQAFISEIQFIIIATIGAAVYMYIVIIQAQTEQFEKQKTENSRIETELSMASAIQSDMLPHIFPAFPDRPDFEIYASMHPAKEVGGDFYDFFLIDEDKLAVVIADVSGKGVPAALFMMVSKILVQNYAMIGMSPKEVLNAVNNQICMNNREDMFVTVWLGIMDLKTGCLTAANAGHEYPVIKTPDGNFDIVKDKHGFVIGGMPNFKYSEYSLDMQPGSKLFVYTDGVMEATDQNGELFGAKRTLAALNKYKNDSPENILKGVEKEVKAFVGEAPQFDDITMLCLEYKGKRQVAEPKEMTIFATLENLQTVTDFVNSELEKLGCSFKVQTQIDVAIDELFGNIAHYAYKPEVGPATVRVEVEEEPLAVVITFIDNGKPYDPLSNADPDVTLSAEDREIGGLGVFLVKKTMDDVSYEYKNGQNILKIKKNM